MGLSTNLQSHWSLEAASGTRVDDVVATGNDLTDTNTVTQNTGKIGNCAQFTAANLESLSRADNASLSTGDIDFCFAAWIYMDTLANETIVSKYNIGGNNREYLLYYNASDHAPNSRFSFTVSATGTSTITTVDATNFGAPSATTWYYVIAWHDSVNNVIGISIDDGTPNTAAHSTGVFDGNSTFRIGDIGNLYAWNGRIDQVAYWKNYIPDATERTWLRNAGTGRTYAEIAAYETVGQPMALRQSFMPKPFGRGF